jgi:DNA-directed RNA polymerase subunit RPC12/RpoP
MAVCSNCGKELDGETMFCENCGTKVIRQTETTATYKNTEKTAKKGIVKGKKGLISGTFWYKKIFSDKSFFARLLNRRKDVELIYNNDFVDFQFSDTYSRRISVSSISAVFVELKKASRWLLFIAICALIVFLAGFTDIYYEIGFYDKEPIQIYSFIAGIIFMLIFLFSNKITFGIRSDGCEYSVSRKGDKSVFDEWIIEKDMLNKLVIEARNGKL